MEHAAPPDHVARTAAEQFGIPYLYPFQRLVISNVVDSLDAHAAGNAEEVTDLHDRQIVILPTGAGKSLCFQIPARMRPGLTVVVFPILSLIADQGRRLKESGTTAYTLTGATPPTKRRELWRKIARAPRAMLLTNPESTTSPQVRRKLREIGVAHLVIDEAHCVTEWGESFRPAYRSLAGLIEETEPAVVTAFTATASPRIVDDLRELLFGGGAHLIQGDPDRTNISYAVLPTLSKRRSLRLLYAPPELGSRDAPPDPAAETTDAAEAANLPVVTGETPVPVPSILFCRSRGEAERAAAELRQFLPARRVYFYHAGLSREEKNRVEEWFFESDDGILTSTCAYGMGVDKKNIRSVLHLRPAPSVESYLQESGRGGRDRAPARAALLLAPSDLVALPGAENSRLRSYLVPLLTGNCRRQALLTALGAENDNCTGCDRCNGTESAALRPDYLSGRQWWWPGLRGSSLEAVLLGRRTPAVMENRGFLSPYWGRCAGWEAKELDEAKEELSMARKLTAGSSSSPERAAISAIAAAIFGTG